jgi:hypothetical protein
VRYVLGTLLWNSTTDHIPRCNTTPLYYLTLTASREAALCNENWKSFRHIEHNATLKVLYIHISLNKRFEGATFVSITAREHVLVCLARHCLHFDCSPREEGNIVLEKVDYQASSCQSHDRSNGAGGSVWRGVTWNPPPH